MRSQTKNGRKPSSAVVRDRSAGRHFWGRIRWLIGLYGVIVSVASCGSVAAASSQAESAPALLAQATHDAEASGWVHETASASGEGHSLSMVNDIGSAEGRQVIVANGAHAQVIVVNGDAYLNGDANAIAHYFEISTTDPQKYANQWLELTPSNPGYSTVSGAVTLNSDFGHLDMPKHLTLGKAVIVGGHKLEGISGHIAATSQHPAVTVTLYVTTSGKVLPVKYEIAGKGLVSTTSWSNWGHGVQLSVPSSTLLTP
jgi:hypothetical protein